MFKFRTRVKVVNRSGLILRPDGVQTQSAFFEGVEGSVVRHDEAKGGYLVVIDCPEIKAAFGETITAYFLESELDEIPAQALTLTSSSSGRLAMFEMPDHAKPGPFEYPTQDEPLTGYRAQVIKGRKDANKGGHA